MSMKLHQKNRVAAAATLAIVVMAGASTPARADSSQPKATSATVRSAPAPGAWVTARQKHNASGLLLRYQTPAAVKAGQRSTVVLTVAGVTAAEGAQVEVKGSDPSMTILMSSNPVNSPIMLTGGEMRRIDLQVVNAPEGLHYVNVLLTQNGRSNAVAIPIKVGHGQMTQKPHGEAQTTPAGEKIIVLPSTPK